MERNTSRRRICYHIAVLLGEVFFLAWEKLVIDLKNIQMTPFFRLTEDYCIIFEHGDYFSTLIDDFQRPNHSIN